jgi:hypothetical protein
MSLTQIPVQHLFTLALQFARAERFDFVGPFGRRIFERPTHGTVTGTRVNGKVLELLATDYGNASLDGRIRQLDAYVTAQTDDGTVILMQVRGRGSPAYGAGQSRIQIIFMVGPGDYDWLNHTQAIGIGREDGESSTYEVYALTGAPESAAAIGAGGSAAERENLAAEYLFTRQSQHTPGAIRHIVECPLGRRFLTLAEGGGEFGGPKVRGRFIPGFSWSPHRMEATPEQPRYQYDVKTLLRTDDGVPILMSYVGVLPPSYHVTGVYMTAILFEVPDGPYAWLNELQAVGVGRKVGAGAQYTVYGLK